MEYSISLIGKWRYKVDEQSRGDQEEFYAIDYDTGEWSEMKIPTNWQLSGVEDYCGVVWFQRDVEIPPEYLGKQILILFKGVDYFTDLWVNGEYVGTHEGYFQPFTFDLTSYLKVGEKNRIMVRVESPYEQPGTEWPHRKRLIKGIFNHHDARPGSWNSATGQLKNTGGIWNNIELKIYEEVGVTELKVAPRLVQGGEAILRTIATIYNFSSKDRKIQLLQWITPDNFEGESYRKEVFFELTPGKNQVTLIQKVDHPHLWWTWDHGEQHLYKAKVEIVGVGGGAQFEQVFGIREIHIDEKQNWYLNGRHIFVRGTNTIPTQWLSEYSPEMIAQDLSLMKAAHINGVRVHAHINRQEFYDACDREGVLVWQDFALQWSYQTTIEFMQEAVRQIKDMVHHLYNHPSIVVWCCHNEPDVNRHELDLVLFDAVREEDATRHITPASDFTEHAYPGWYFGHYREYSGFPNAPFVNEFGAQALPNEESMIKMFSPEDLWPPKWESWAFHDFQYDQTFNVVGIEMGNSIKEFVNNSQKYQYDLLKYSIESYRRGKYQSITSIFQFMFVDCWPAITWSVVDYYRQPKLGYKALQKAFQPILISAQWGRKKLVAGVNIFDAIYVVNDYHRDFLEVTVTLTFESEDQEVVLREERMINIKRDSNERIIDGGITNQNWILPVGLVEGKYYLHMKLIDSFGKTLSENDEQFLVVHTSAINSMIF